METDDGRTPPYSAHRGMGDPPISLATKMGRESLLPLFKCAHKPTEWGIKKILSQISKTLV